MTKVSSFRAEEQSANYKKIASRKWLARGSDVHVKEFILAPGEEVPWHTHSKVFDIFYCVEGAMTIERQDAQSKTALPTLSLKVGDSAKVDVGTAHRVSPKNSAPCRFVIIQGVGEYDYVSYKPS